MAYVLTGQQVHEWTGTVLVFLVICHNSLNRKWYGAVGKGAYSRRRMVMTVLNFAILVVIAALFTSGIVMSRYTFRFLPVRSGRALARRVHIVCAYWGFLLMAAHFGMHWNGIWGRLKRRFHLLQSIGEKKRLLSLAGAAVSLYGVRAIYRHEILSFLFMKNEFAMFDPEYPGILFVLDYLAILVLVVNLVRRREHV